MTHPAYGVLREVSPVASVLLENNPSTMTLEGTNTWVLRAPGAAGSVVVDPGYEDPDHLGRIAATGPVELIVLTHHHSDHAEGAPWLAERVDAPVRAFAAQRGGGATPFRHDDVITAGGLEMQVLHTPGHTADSVTLRCDNDGRSHLLTGDTVLGTGTTVLSDLGAYLRSLRTLRALPPGALGLPGHGPELADLPATALAYAEHRQRRLDQVRNALRVLGPDATPRQVVEVVYAEVDRALWGPAEASVVAQMKYLRADTHSD
jgi:glyoxylase-like metal-dependent hydrolase (beta-lactamase superfamily II)